MGSRKPIPSELQSKLLVDSARRCALCFGLEGDLDRKKGQIAHVDGDSSNAAESNLVFLCMDHHDEYDSRTSQSKGITQLELAEYKKRLVSAISGGLLGRARDPGFPTAETNEHRRDRILIEPFWGVVGSFWARFRLMMFGIRHAFQLDDDVCQIFGINVAITEGSVDVDRIDKQLVERIFRSVDFSSNSNATHCDDGNLSICFEPDAAGKPGTVPWANWLTAEIAAVDFGCDRLLVRFGSGSRPEIIEQISLLQNWASALHSIVKHIDFASPSDESILCLWHFFEHLKLSTELIGRIRKTYQMPGSNQPIV